MVPLSQRALNRALLERQLLIRPSGLAVTEVIGHLAGMQAQAPYAPYFGLWSRLDGFRPGDLADLITDRSVVRIALMRGTVHLVTAADCLAWRPVFQPVLARGFKGTYGARLEGVDLEELLATGRKLVEEKPLTNAELGPPLTEQWPERDKEALVQAVRFLAPLVQVPPRAIWGSGGQARCTTAEAWLGGALGSDPAPDAAILRYLAAFGPATVKDIQVWSGLTRLREVTGRLDLRVFADESGAKLLDLPDAPLPDPETPVGVRFLPEYDNILRSHLDRTRVMDDAVRQRLASRNDSPKPTFLVDGFVRGTWRLKEHKGTATLEIEPFGRLSKKDAAEVTSEAARLLEFAAEDAVHEITFIAAV